MKITDDLLFEHAAEARDIWVGTLLEDTKIPEIQCSKSFERKMKKLIKEQHNTLKSNKSLHYAKRTVAAILVAAMLSFAGLMTVEAYRERVIEIIIHVFNEFTDYRFSSSSNDADEIILPELFFEYVPAGMQEVENRLTSNNRRYILYEDTEDNFFELTQRTIGADGKYGMILDTEDADSKTMIINGNEAFCNNKDGCSSVIWGNDNVVYYLYGNINLNELQSIAEKIKILEN